MASIDNLLKGFERLRIDIEQRNAQQAMRYGGYRELLFARLAALQEASMNGDEEAMGVLKRFAAKVASL